MIAQHRLDSPPQDFELGLRRASLRFRVALPASGVDGRTGLVFYIFGYGFAFDDPYADALMQRLADRFNLVAVSVDYFGNAIHRATDMAVDPVFFSYLAERHGLRIEAPPEVPMAVRLQAAFEALAARGCTRIEAEAGLVACADEYHSFGLLPALDHLAVLHHLLSAMNLDKSRLHVLGSSYGGYIAGLLLKLAPHSFRMVVDNSGFSSPHDDLPGIHGYTSRTLFGMQATLRARHRFEPDPASPAWFSSARFAIRDLRERHHVTPSKTHVFGYHSAEDRLADIDRKRELVDTYRGLVAFDQTVVTADMLDGRMFKTLDHGMQASLSRLFEHSYARLPAEGSDAETDFDRGTRLSFPCTDMTYWVEFGEHGVRAGARER